MLKDCVVNKNSDIITVEADPIKCYAFDFETDSHRHAQTLSNSLPTFFQLDVHFMSHGEYVKNMLHLLTLTKKALVLFDEPDTALSPRSCLNLGRLFYKITSEQECQIIATTHNPILFMTELEVYSLDHFQWIPGEDYLQSHLSSPIDNQWLTYQPDLPKKSKPKKPNTKSRFFKNVRGNKI